MKVVQISNKKPPQWILDAVKEKFDVDWESDVIFTYGDLITTHSGMMTEDLIAHESHHTVQQEEFGGPDKWWKKYLADPEFRYEQELECYRLQYKWLIKNEKSRNQVFRFLDHYARSLSGEMYGGLATYSEAMKAIKGE
jgi:hypothetical protein